jgi:hypothetical protein
MDAVVEFIAVGNPHANKQTLYILWEVGFRCGNGSILRDPTLQAGRRRFSLPLESNLFSAAWRKRTPHRGKMRLSLSGLSTMMTTWLRS